MLATSWTSAAVDTYEGPTARCLSSSPLSFGIQTTAASHCVVSYSHLADLQLPFSWTRMAAVSVCVVFYCLSYAQFVFSWTQTSAASQRVVFFSNFADVQLAFSWTQTAAA